MMQFAKGPQRDSMEVEKEGDESQLMGCAPYLQIFKAGKLVFTTAATLHVQQTEEELPFVQVMDGTVPFNIDEVIQGDILIRCRHLTFNKQRVSMFRAAFHTGYVPPNVLRLTKSQLDGACTDKRFSDDYFVDLIFEKVDAETATKHLEEQQQEEEAATADEGENEKKGRSPIVKASSFDTMLHGDSRFWDVITSRRREQVKQKNEDPMWGKTIGRRRGEPAKKQQEGNEQDPQNDSVKKERTSLETFSIGNEFDFLPGSPVPVPRETTEPTKDDLMDALNALDDDEGPSSPTNTETEEIVFDTSGEAGSSDDKKDLIQEIPASVPSSEAQGVTDDFRQDSQPKDSKVSETAKEPTSAPSQASSDDNALEEIDDMDALLAAADEDLGDIDLGDFDVDDDLEDLENFLKT